jgi:hypothetical protein
MPCVYVADVPEFSGLVASIEGAEGVTISPVRAGYIAISSDQEIVFNRRAAGFKPAVWYSCLSGGVHGQITEYGRDILRISGGQTA